MSYFAVKHIHITFAALSGLLFFIRGLMMLSDAGMLQRRWAKVVPHVIDTVLLASALVMVVWSAQYPFAQGWLTAKLVGLIAYIVLGVIALRPGRSRKTRIAAFVAALAVFAYIIKVAVTRQVL